MRRALLATAAILAAVLIQVTVLNNIPFPGGAGPDLVLVVVVAMALAGGPAEGAVIGFAAGLALDIAPPASNLVGQSALVFCLVGYGCGRLRGALERSAWLPLAGVALGAVVGEVLYVLVGLMFSDPDITWPAVRQVLPAAVCYDLLISPFVLYAVAWLGGYARWGADSAPAGLLTGRELAGAGVLAGAAAGGAVRDTGTGRSPRLRPATGHRSDGWIGGRKDQAGVPSGAWVDRPRPLRLRLRGGTAGSAAGGMGKAAAARPLAAAVNLRLAAPRRRDGTLVTRRGMAGGAAGAAFGSGAGRPPRLRGGALSGGPSAMRPAGSGRKREARLKLGSKSRRDSLGGGSRLRWRWPSRMGRRQRMGRGSFATGAPARGGAGFSAARGPSAVPRFRGLAHRRRAPGPAPRTAAPRFRRPAMPWRHGGRGLGGMRGSSPSLRPRRRRWRPGSFGKGGLR